MAPNRPGQLDEISQTIGRLEGKVDGIEEYIHDRRHEDKSVSMKIDGLSTQVTREVARMKAEIQVQIEAISVRVAKLEDAAAGDRRQRNIIAIIVQSPLVGWIAGLLAFVWAMATHGGQQR